MNPDPDGKDKPKRRKASYVGVPGVFQLELACQHLHRAYGTTPYLVGSALERPDWRDIDLVIILPDDEFQREFPNVDIKNGLWESDPKWLIHTVALSNWLSGLTGLPIDFKIQARSKANELHKGPRNAMGLYH